MIRKRFESSRYLCLVFFLFQHPTTCTYTYRREFNLTTREFLKMKLPYLLWATILCTGTQGCIEHPKCPDYLGLMVEIRVSLGLDFALLSIFYLILRLLWVNVGFCDFSQSKSGDGKTIQYVPDGTVCVAYSILCFIITDLMDTLLLL